MDSECPSEAIPLGRLALCCRESLGPLAPCVVAIAEWPKIVEGRRDYPQGLFIGRQRPSRRSVGCVRKAAQSRARDAERGARQAGTCARLGQAPQWSARPLGG